MRFLKFTHLEHFHHLFLVAKKQNTPVFARHALNLSDDRVDDCGLVRIMRTTSTTFPTTAVQTVRLKERSVRVGVQGVYLILASSITRTLPTVASRMAFVFFSDSPRALPTKSAGFLITTGITMSETKFQFWGGALYLLRC